MSAPLYAGRSPNLCTPLAAHRANELIFNIGQGRSPDWGLSGPLTKTETIPSNRSAIAAPNGKRHRPDVSAAKVAGFSQTAARIFRSSTAAHFALDQANARGGLRQVGDASSCHETTGTGHGFNCSQKGTCLLENHLRCPEGSAEYSVHACA